MLQLFDKKNPILLFREERKRGDFMKKLAVLLPLALFIAFISTAHTQSLSDLAKKEKERRAQVKDDKVITAEEAEKYTSSSPEASAPEAPSTAADSAKADGGAEKSPETEKADPDEPTDFQGRPESYWRKTMAEARQKIKDLTNEANVLQLKIAELQNKFYSMDDGFNRETIQRELQKTYYQQDMNKENLKNAEAALQDLENEARKSGALPGWIQ
jgi:hypothetical protein